MSKNKEQKKKKNCTYIGGQAVLEGVMMRGKTAYATAVRDPEGHIQVESRRLHSSAAMKRVAKIPIVRGVVNFVSSLVTGSKILMRSAEVAEGDEEQPSKAEKWLAEKHKVNLNSVWNIAAIVLGVLLAVLIFVLLPQYLTGFTGFATTGLEGLWFNLIEGGIRMVIFLLYIVGISVFPTLARVYRYHGAEHKTIKCYELGHPLTVENIRPCTRKHPRCGTSFLLIVLVVSVLVFSLVTWENLVVRVLLKIALLPVTVGISFEIIRYAGRYSNPLTHLISAPGLWLQRLTTAEPDTEHIEVAIASMKPCIPEDGSDQWGA